MVRFLWAFSALILIGQNEVGGQINAEVKDILSLEEASAVLTRVQQLIADPRGGAWVLDSQIEGVVRFTENGEMLVFGRKGSGPGEFQRPWRMSLVRDTLWVVDLGLHRISGLDPLTGESLGTINGRPLWLALPEVGTPLQVTETGILVAVEEPESGTVALVLLDRDELGKSRDLMRLERSDSDLHVEVPGHSDPIRITNPFSNSDLLALDNYGKYVARVRQSPSFEVEVVELRNEPERTTISWALERRNVTNEERAAWQADQRYSISFARARFFASEEEAGKAIEDALVTGLAPVVRRLTRGVFEQSAFIDEDGDLWFEGWSGGEAPHKWFRLTPEGAEPELTFRNGELLLDIAGRFLWKQAFNSLDVPRLTRVELRALEDSR